MIQEHTEPRSALIKKRFDLQVNLAGALVSNSFELDKNIICITGLLLTSDKEELLYNRGSQKIELNKQELFPEKYESKLLMSGLNVSPNERYYRIHNHNIGNRQLKIEYADNQDSRIAFSPYRVSIYLECELEASV
jgi:hypothetical protein